ncbi:PREDICTED: calcium channel flower isoform X1 [Diuraphis noxia]|uniref:calcium channel flower isoform X1 n=1 Tax=Diuraphis noxia TaxID=143948 RepID=UPI0007638F7E|nr:PREDICTED: calcium channel flower isoform X1 [Diuraphis noxia]XP_015376646.1 PREDICTED: calcium channel flower isoform X1 [Diuraphis noxia]
MSMGDKVTNLWKRASDEGENRDEIPWHLKYGSRTLGTFAGIVNLFTGIWNGLGLIFLNTDCLFGGIIQLLLGLLLIALEAPFLCVFIDYMQKVSDVAENKPYWTRAVLYAGLSLVPMLLCFGPSTLIASALVFCTGLLYGLMSVGKKGSREDMGAIASPVDNVSQPMGGHHTTFMEDPDVWRPT